MLSILYNYGIIYFVTFSINVGIIIECPKLVDPTNGDVAYSGNTPGSSATYTCIAGYSITGDDIRFCLNDGTWSGNDPFCRCESILPAIIITKPHL